jgi:hypothetical protein
VALAQEYEEFMVQSEILQIVIEGQQGVTIWLHWRGISTLLEVLIDTFCWTSRADVEPFLWKNMRYIRKECESMAPNSKFP